MQRDPGAFRSKFDEIIMRYFYIKIKLGLKLMSRPARFVFTSNWFIGSLDAKQPAAMMLMLYALRIVDPVC